ncbi:putative nucleotidyltransferase with HDIG domain [Deinococcus metalli]|nr:HD-GYP domain-containing protein [Deinococcus metalli]MBB5375162.1 putative nucleotidyltransferase with HDIG domain [Deinococcus metalli]
MAARQAALLRLSGLPLDALLAARWGVPQLIAPPTRLRPDATLTETAVLHAASPDGTWLRLSWQDASIIPEAAPEVARPIDVPAPLLEWLRLGPEDALGEAGRLLLGSVVTRAELTDGLSLHQLCLGDAPGTVGDHALLLGSPEEPLGELRLSAAPRDVPDDVHAVAWALTQVARHARQDAEIRRREHAAQRAADLHRALLSVVSGDAPPEAVVYAATRLLHARAGTRVTTRAGIPEAYGGWVTAQLRGQVMAQLAAGMDPRPTYAVLPADELPVLIVPLGSRGPRRSAWVFQLSRRPWFLRPQALDSVLEAARHPVHADVAADTRRGAGLKAPAGSAPRSVLGLLQHLTDSDAPAALASEGLAYLTPPGSGTWGAYLSVRSANDDGQGGGVVTLSSVARSGNDADHPRPAALQAVVAAFWHTVGDAGGLSLSAPHPLLPAPLRRLCLAPVRTAGGHRLAGVLVVGNGPEEARADAQMPTLLTVLAQQITRAAERQLAMRQLSRAREQTFRVLGRVLEHRSYETKGHTDRVTSLALKLGLQLNLTYDQLTVLRWGAYLHDIGKIAIPDAVLNKEGPLNRSERGLMHEHVVIGEGLLREQELVPEGVLEIVRHHHERWDGAGYPDGLRGDGIPLLARAFAVVDVYDALTSARAYKPSWTQERSLTELARMAGHALDPRLTGVFMDMIRRGDVSVTDDQHAPFVLPAD